MRGLVAALLVAAAGLGGCATAKNPADPLEPWNRGVYAFNDKVDEVAIKPAATAYKNVVPEPVRTAFTNFFGNIYDVWSAANLFMQGRVVDGLNEVMRVGSNTLFGFLGFADPATEMGLVKHNEDFGQTLGVWGVPPGPYIVWPILGPSTARDSVGLPLDIRASPETFVHDVPTRNEIIGLRLVNTRANLLGGTKLLDEIALDKYTFVRDAYLQRRRSLISNGEAAPPDDNDYDPGPTDNSAPNNSAPNGPADTDRKTQTPPAAPAAPAAAASKPPPAKE